MPRITCRRMDSADIEAVIALLGHGFPERASDYWRRGLARLRDREVPDELPRFGYVLTDHGRLVGVILLMFARTDEGGVRGNVSSWYVVPGYRAYSGMLLAAPLKLGVTILNISPAPATIATIEAQGFRRYVDGTFTAAAALGRRVSGVRLRATDPSAMAGALERSAPGSLALTATTPDGDSCSFVFLPRRLAVGRLPCAQLIYCRSLADFVRLAGPLGRHLLRHGLPLVILDANGSVPGLIGRYRAGRRTKYFHGSQPPRLGDLTGTELTIFGP